MPIPFREQEDLENLGNAAFLKIEERSAPPGYRAALFQINARGEPIEFTYNRLDTPNTFLWRPSDIRRASARQLTASLLRLCPRAPRLILCLADEVPAELFGEDIAVTLPVCRVARAATATAAVVDLNKETGEVPLRFLWHPAQPDDGTPERLLLEQLISHGLLLEPFERASAGLRELYGEADPENRPERPGL